MKVQTNANKGDANFSSVRNKLGFMVLDVINEADNTRVNHQTATYLVTPTGVTRAFLLALFSVMSVWTLLTAIVAKASHTF
jgi:hypothetical protein